ncbi:hypothetical protein H8E50_03780 [bacterium]|nr:hypothetical protein [bacterium]
MVACEFYDDCKRMRTEQAEFKGTLVEKVANIEKVCGAIWDAIEKNRDDVKQLYFRVGMVAGTVSLFVNVIFLFLKSTGK